MNYLSWCIWIANLGPLAPQVLSILAAAMSKINAALQEARTAFTSLLTTVPPHPVMMAAAPLSHEEQAAENAAIAALNQHGPHHAMAAAPNAAAWDGTILKQIWAFIQSNPVLAQLLMQLIGQIFTPKPTT